jgi:glucose-6-phosphate dehydrogenase assembly protein OpcA
VAADLPVVVWVHGQNLIHASEFAALFRLAGKLIVDSTNAARPEDMLVRIRALTGARRGVADLSWTRLTRWREVIAQFLGAPEFRERLPAIDAVAISYCGDKPPTRTLYLSAWLRRSIGDHVRIRFESGRPDHPEGIHRVAFTGADAEINMQLAGHFIEVRTGNHEARHHFPPLRDYDLLREELSLAGHDPTFEAVLTALCEGGLNRVFQRT